jgi:hypothetical protein
MDQRLRRRKKAKEVGKGGRKAMDGDGKSRGGRGLTSIDFFNPGRGHVPALGVFVFFDAPFPFAFSSCSKLKA